MFKNLQLTTKMFLSFGFVTLISVSLGILGYYGAVKSDKAIEEVGMVRLPGVQSLQIIKTSVNGLNSAMANLLIPGLDKELHQHQYDNINKARETYEVAWKTYESLPHSLEESELWEQLGVEWQKWRESNGVYLDLLHEVDSLDLGNHVELWKNLEKFRGDHYKVATNVLKLLKDGKSFDGGDDQHACNFGKWLATFETSNPQMKQVLQDILPMHDRFHKRVQKVKKLATEGKTDEASSFYTTQIVASMESTFGEFNKMIDLAKNADDSHKEAAHQLLEIAHEHQINATNLLDKIISLNGEISTHTVNTSKHNAKLLETVILFAVGIGVVLALFCAILVTKGITGPVQKVVAFVDKVAKGDFTSTLVIDQQDEVGKMSTALSKTVSELGSMIKDIISGVNTLSSSSTELAAISTQLSTTSAGASERANSVASASEEMSVNMSSVSAAMEQSASNVGMVATAAEEMSTTVSEIAGSASRAKTISENAVIQSQESARKVTDLGTAADKIGKVTEVITEISEQTNLLALNATIEAARAGEAGKGFAVVANEIKELAKQTAEATVDIKVQIEGMQGTTSSTISDIKTISEVINEINDVITTIASAVEQQSAATSEISENVAQAAGGIGEVNENVAQSSVAIQDINRDITEISNGSSEINSSSQNVNQSANELSKLAEQLSGLVSRFKVA
ncbi:MAG: methyl-accepting chemotaxis protein [Desulforhopalus sp.]